MIDAGTVYLTPTLKFSPGNSDPAIAAVYSGTRRRNDPMNPAVTLRARVDGILRGHSNSRMDAVERPTVLIATMDPAIRVGLTELLQSFSVETIWLQGVEATKRMLSRKRIAACLCGFWLQDGT